MNSAGAPMPAAAARALDEASFRRITALAESEAGLHIPAAKFSMVESRLNRRLRATGVTSYSAYLDLVEAATGVGERKFLISALTTNVSHFFRENHHFETLSGKVLPELLPAVRSGGRLRIWSAGCSTGQEPYSIAMTLLQADPNIGRLDVKILATDIDEDVLEVARTGAYDARQIEGVPVDLRRKFFTHDSVRDTFTVTQALRDLVTFRPLNIIRDWPMRGTFDAAFCRNVVIYFSEDTQRVLWPRFQSSLKPGGWLFLGHSERVHDADRSNWITSGVTTYRKAGAAAAGTEKKGATWR